MIKISFRYGFSFIELAKEGNVGEEQAVWLISAIGVTNTLGRLVSGIIKSFTKINAAMIIVVSLVISGGSCFITLFTVTVESLFVFACFFGFFTGTDLSNPIRRIL